MFGWELLPAVTGICRVVCCKIPIKNIVVLISKKIYAFGLVTSTSFFCCDRDLNLDALKDHSQISVIANNKKN